MVGRKKNGGGGEGEARGGTRSLEQWKVEGQGEGKEDPPFQSARAVAASKTRSPLTFAFFSSGEDGTRDRRRGNDGI